MNTKNGKGSARRRPHSPPDNQPCAQPTPKMETLKESFQARWPVPDSNRPMNDAMSAVAQAVSSCTGQDADTWKTTVSQTWQPALEEVVEAYFKAARTSFEKGDPLDGVETLTDAVRATLGHIARRPKLAPQHPRQPVQNSRSSWEAGTNGPTRWRNSTGPWRASQKRATTWARP